MISNIIEILGKSDYYNVSETVEIAKGKNEYVSTFKDFKRKVKRQWLLKKK